MNIEEGSPLIITFEKGDVIVRQDKSTYVMDIKRIVSIIGYTDRTIRWHINKELIVAIIQDRKYLVSKYSLIIKRNEAASSLVSE